MKFTKTNIYTGPPNFSNLVNSKDKAAIAAKPPVSSGKTPVSYNTGKKPGGMSLVDAIDQPGPGTPVFSEPGLTSTSQSGNGASSAMAERKSMVDEGASGAPVSGKNKTGMYVLIGVGILVVIVVLVKAFKK